MFEEPERATQERLTFSMEGLSARDELLLKSFIRLLEHRTHHHWSYRAEAADLKMAGDETLLKDEGERGATSSAVQDVLRLSHGKAYPAPFLRLPMRSNELELMLNMLGADIVKRKASEARMPVTPVLDNGAFRLLKWPSSALMKTPARLKMATLLTGAPVTMEMLAQRTGLDVAECADFCRDLLAAGLLDRSIQAQTLPEPTAASRKQPTLKMDILSRIRTRLGLKATVQK